MKPRWMLAMLTVGALFPVATFAHDESYDFDRGADFAEFRTFKGCAI